MVLIIEYSISNLRKRLFAILLLIAFLFCLILGRFFYVQVIWGKELRAKAIDQWTRELPIVAPRGIIKDRNGKVIVDNTTMYSVFIRPRSITNEIKVAEILSNIFNLNKEDIYKKAKTKSISEYTIVRQCGQEKIDLLCTYSLDGVYYSKDSIRYYPYGDFLTQVLGYVSSDNIGQSGIEKYYNKFLSGTDGEILYETDLLGIQLNQTTPKFISSKSGLNIVLTIDNSIQQIVEQTMETAFNVHLPKRAECIVLDPSNGEILAMASKPSYDLNYVPRDDIDLLNRLSRNGLVVDVYEPGSTFKILTAAATLEEYHLGNPKALSPDYVFNSSRTRTVLGRNIKCWRTHEDGKHSGQHIKEALNNSCNPCFVDMALSLGKETMYNYIELFNYGSVTGVDFIGEAQGMIIPEPAVTDGDLARIGFGQTIAVTPIQLASATAAAVNGGFYYTPHLMKAIYDGDMLIEEVIPIVKNRTISKETSELLSGYLEGVVSEGSGKQAYIEGYKVGGKTGTAQKYEKGIIAQGKYVASFVGFFPSNNPKYLALVIIDEPQGQHYGSTVAAPYAKMIFEGIINKKEIAPYM